MKPIDVGEVQQRNSSRGRWSKKAELNNISLILAHFVTYCQKWRNAF